MSEVHKLVVVCPYDVTVPGGVQAQAVGLSHEMVARGWSVTLAAPNTAAWSGREAIQCFELGSPIKIKANGSLAPVSLHLGRARALASFVEARGVGVAHVHEPLAPVASWPLLRRHAVGIVATFHRAGVDAPARIGGRVLRRQVSGIDVACAVSPSAAQTADDICGVDAEVLFNGIVLDEVVGVEPWPTRGPTILFLGRNEPRKGRAVLLDAARRLDPGITIWATGDQGSWRPGEGATVEFLGTITDTEKARRLASADVLCAPALGGESFGIVLLEGLAAGANVVASDIEGYRAALGGFGELVPPGDVASLAEALVRALSTERAPIAQLEAYLSSWSMAALADRYEAHYDALLAKRTSSSAK
jgi:phosphatidyl-myo-inositol alpha-mannosyltransferase